MGYYLTCMQRINFVLSPSNFAYGQEPEITYAYSGFLWPAKKENENKIYLVASREDKAHPLLVAFILYFDCLMKTAIITILNNQRQNINNIHFVFTAFKYHAFIIYSTTESEWVNNVLLSTLQSNGFRCCIHWKDFQPGSVFAQSIADSVHDSYKIIAVVSESFVQKGICEFEINHAITRLMNEGDDCLIIIKYDNVDLKVHLPSLLDRSYIDLPNETDRSTWESRVVSVLQEAIIEEEASVHSEEHSNNNYEHDGNSSSDDSSQELTCYCQSRGLITTHETHSACRS